jgi:hypothetical protein
MLGSRQLCVADRTTQRALQCVEWHINLHIKLQVSTQSLAPLTRAAMVRPVGMPAATSAAKDGPLRYASWQCCDRGTTCSITAQSIYFIIVSKEFLTDGCTLVAWR